MEARVGCEVGFRSASREQPEASKGKPSNPKNGNAEYWRAGSRRKRARSTSLGFTAASTSRATLKQTETSLNYGRAGMKADRFSWPR